MIPAKTLPLLVCGSALVLGAGTPGDKIEFAPEAGSSLRKTFRESTSLALEDFGMVMNGEEDDRDQELEIDVTATRTLAVTDTWAAVEGGRPTKLVRSFDELGYELRLDVVEDGGDEEMLEAESESELAESAVQFTWDEEDEEYAAAWRDDEDGDSDLLEGLVEDADLRGFLPRGEVAEGDSWTLGEAAIAPLLRPLGELTFEPDVDEDSDEAEPILFCFFWCVGEAAEELEGEGEATYAGRSEDDEDLARIEFDLSAACSRDIVDAMQRIADATDIEEPDLLAMSEADIEMEIEGSGELLWNTAEGRVESLSFEGEVTLGFVGVIEQDFGGDTMTMELFMELAGETELTLETE